MWRRRIRNLANIRIKYILTFWGTTFLLSYWEFDGGLIPVSSLMRSEDRLLKVWGGS